MTLVIATMLLATTLESQERSEAITLPGQGTAEVVFGGAEIRRVIRLSADADACERIGWSLAASRTLDAGEVAIGKNENDERVATVAIRIPVVKRGATLATGFTATAINNNGKAVGRATHTIHVFPKEVTVKHQIGVFDPNNTTAPALKDAAFAIEHMSTLAEIKEHRGKLLIVAHAVNFSDWGELTSVLLELATKGTRILCLKPNGTIDAAPITQPKQIRAFEFRKASFIDRFDKRFQARHWLARKSPQAGMGLSFSDRTLRFDRKGGWAWCKVTCGRGEVSFCNLPLIGHWKTSPVPRHFVASWANSANANAKE